LYIDSIVFLIEDDAAVQDAIKISLAMAGFNVEEYSSGKAFLDAYNGDRPGCILINLRQPEMEGLIMQQELIRRNFNTHYFYDRNRVSLELSAAYAVRGFLLAGETYSQTVAA
jgi:FixJ family two-component response regulator